MMSTMILFPSRTVALHLLGLQIHWYGILYLVAFVLAAALLQRLQGRRGLALSRDEWSGLLTAGILGVILGGRFGYVLFYEPRYFLAAPWKILAVWEGGMSSHGGFIGVVVALYLKLRGRSWDEILRIADVVTVPVALGLLCGRIGNFINQELYGIATVLPWGIHVPGSLELHHPTQIYAAIKDLFIAGVCFWHLRRSAPPGQTLAIFLMLYGVLRFLLEFLRFQDYPFVHLGLFELSRGQVLSLPIVAVGVWLLWKTLRLPSPSPFDSAQDKL